METLHVGSACIFAHVLISVAHVCTQDFHETIAKHDTSFFAAHLTATDRYALGGFHDTKASSVIPGDAMVVTRGFATDTVAHTHKTCSKQQRHALEA